MKSLSEAKRSVASPDEDVVSNDDDNDESIVKTVSTNRHSSRAYCLYANVSFLATETARLIDPPVTRCAVHQDSI